MAVQTPELVRIEKADLFGRDRMHDGPVIPGRAAQLDEYGTVGAAIEKARHGLPKFIQGNLGVVLEGHAAVPDPVSHHIPQNAADLLQTDALGQHRAQFAGSLQVHDDPAEKLARRLFIDAGDDPGRVYNTVNCAQSIQCALKIRSHCTNHGCPIEVTQAPCEKIGCRWAARLTSKGSAHETGKIAR